MTVKEIKDQENKKFSVPKRRRTKIKDYFSDKFSDKEKLLARWKGTAECSNHDFLSWLFDEKISKGKITENSMVYLGYVGKCINIEEDGWRFNSVVNYDMWERADNFIDDGFDFEEWQEADGDFEDFLSELKEFLKDDQAQAIAYEIKKEMELVCDY